MRELRGLVARMGPCRRWLLINGRWPLPPRFPLKMREKMKPCKELTTAINPANIAEKMVLLFQLCFFSGKNVHRGVFRPVLLFFNGLGN